MDENIKYCPFCGGIELKEIRCVSKHKKTVRDRTAAVHEHESRLHERCFMHCTGNGGCGGFFLLPEYFLPKAEQKKRYLLHNNNLSDAGYRSFLENFADTALVHIRELLGRPPHSIFDYGCGNGSLVELLHSYACGGLLPENTEIRGRDPFFAPDTPFFEGGADAVLCLEVAEHFENPHEGFAGLARACKKGGYAAVQTLFAPESGGEAGADTSSGAEIAAGANAQAAESAFRSWWYKEDTTHVSFYTEKALKACAERAGFEYCGTYSNCSILRAAFPR
ncbi:class I SAM-dependent methyltransferase [Treponema sp. HNW]|uniref:class I SAM-dependent methyltransferase n=1 Tax=Treponema sp. HNW TaxID=3116654 RepID=UPI003D0F15AD